MAVMAVMARMVMAADANLKLILEGTNEKSFLHPGLYAFAALLSFSLMTAEVTFARDGKGGGRPEIQLSAEQKEKARAIFEQNREATAETRQALKEKRDQLKELMRSANPNRVQAEALCSEIGTLQGKMLLSHYDLSQQLVKEGLPAQLANRKAFDGKKDGKGDRRGDHKGDRKDKRKGENRD